MGTSTAWSSVYRIHRIGQTEVCHPWNLVAEEVVREGDVYATLLHKRRRTPRWAATLT